jgi:hypothetical protein
MALSKAVTFWPIQLWDVRRVFRQSRAASLIQGTEQVVQENA